jgi:hypothetical protein
VQVPVESRGIAAPSRDGPQDAWTALVGIKRPSEGGRDYWMMDGKQTPHGLRSDERGNMACRQGAWTVRQLADAPGFVSPNRVQIPMAGRNPGKAKRKSTGLSASVEPGCDAPN